MHASLQASKALRAPAHRLARVGSVGAAALFLGFFARAESPASNPSDTSPVLTARASPKPDTSNIHLTDPLPMEKVTVGDTRMQQAQLQEIEKQLPLNPRFSLTKGGVLRKKTGKHVTAEIGAQPYQDVMANDAKYSDQSHENHPISRLDLVRLQW